MLKEGKVYAAKHFSIGDVVQDKHGWYRKLLFKVGNQWTAKGSKDGITYFDQLTGLPFNEDVKLIERNKN